MVGVDSIGSLWGVCPRQSPSTRRARLKWCARSVRHASAAVSQRPQSIDPMIIWSKENENCKRGLLRVGTQTLRDFGFASNRGFILRTSAKLHRYLD